MCSSIGPFEECCNNRLERVFVSFLGGWGRSWCACGSGEEEDKWRCRHRVEMQYIYRIPVVPAVLAPSPGFPCMKRTSHGRGTADLQRLGTCSRLCSCMTARYTVGAFSLPTLSSTIGEERDAWCSCAELGARSFTACPGVAPPGTSVERSFTNPAIVPVWPS